MPRERSPHTAVLPLGGILDRYLMGAFMRIFLLSLLGFAALPLMVDFFDRIDTLLRAGAPAWTSMRYFLYKLPLLISRVFGFAALFSTIFSVGMLSRTHEITAIRASGVSLQRISLPLLLLSFLICIFTFFWNEGLVPIFYRKAQDIYKIEVRKKQPKNLIGTKDIWMRGEEAFIRVGLFDPKRNVLEGVTIYLLDRDFLPKGLVEVPWARWDGTRWEARGGTQWLLLPDGRMRQRKTDRYLPISETPEDFKLLAREPEEFSFFDLRKQIADLTEKGIDAREYKVDLQVKMAVPVVSPLLVLLAFPFALRHGPGGGMALSFGLTLLIGFGYWVVLAFSISLGHNGALPAWLAAWLPNCILALVGLFFSTGQE